MTALVILVPTKTIFEDTEVSYEETVTYTESEPYTVYEPVNPAFSISEAIKKISNQVSTGCPSDCTCYDDNYFYSGYEKVCIHCICPSPTPEKYQLVTKFREETKTRNVTKMRIEQRPVEVNRVFGFETPWSAHLPVFAPLSGFVDLSGFDLFRFA